MKVKFSESTYRKSAGRNRARVAEKGDFLFVLHSNPKVSLTLRNYTRKEATVRAADILAGAGTYSVRPLHQ